MYRKIFTLLPLALIAVCILVFYFTEGLRFFQFEMIQQEHLKLKAFVQEHPDLSVIYYLGIYIISVLLVLPDSTILTLIGGFLFPMPLAIAYACISETVGATLFFLAVRMASKETIGKKMGARLEQMRVKIRDDQACYLLFLRFSHLLPFWMINMGAGIFNARLSTFIWTTLIGVLPLTFFLVDFGESLSKYFETHTHFHLEGVLTTQLKVVLGAMGCLALLPILYKKFKAKKDAKRK